VIIGGEYASPEKAEIRKRLWDPAFQELVNKYNKPATDIRYLCLPGAQCIYLKHLFQDIGLPKRNVVAVEQYEEAAIAIHHALGGRGVTRQGKIEELFEKRSLDKYFPFDVVDLDFCGPAFVFPRVRQGKDAKEYQRRWQTIERVLELNRSHRLKVFYLLLSIAGVRTNAPGKKFLLREIKSLNDTVGIEKNPSTWTDARLIQEVVPKLLINEALRQDYEISPNDFDSYRYKQQGHQYPMVAFSFRCELVEKTELGQDLEWKSEAQAVFVRTYYSKEPKELRLS